MGSNNPTPLVEAASAGRVDTLQQLLAAEQSPTEETIQSLLNAATWKSQLSAIKLLLLKFPSTPLPEETIRAAIYSGSTEIFSALLAKDPSIINLQFDKRGTPLALACMSRQPVEFLEFLLEAGADPNQYTDVSPQPLVSVAVFYQDTRVAELLLNHGAILKDSGAIERAKGRDNMVMVRYLTEYETEKK